MVLILGDFMHFNCGSTRGEWYKFAIPDFHAVQCFTDRAVFFCKFSRTVWSRAVNDRDCFLIVWAAGECINDGIAEFDLWFVGLATECGFGCLEQGEVGFLLFICLRS